jgi:16S rRNA (adenine1518-N6/adenine1519-N6)-dimethyltransferase
MKRLLTERRIQLTRSLGQSFLHDGNQLRRIVESADLTRTDKVLEIGPGLGPLTELLLQQAGELLAIEKDARLAGVLLQRFPTEHTQGASSHGCKIVPHEVHRARFQLLVDDALEYLRRERRDWSDWKLVANLPYSVASPILVELAQGQGPPERLVATLQIEVAQRIMAPPGDPNYGVLSLLLQLNFAPRSSFKIPASCFFPQPDVDSACVCLRRREDRPLRAAGEELFFRIVKRSFSQRRKMMFKLLRVDWPETRLAKAFEQAAIPAGARAETVSREQFVRLTELLASK